MLSLLLLPVLFSAHPIPGPTPETPRKPVVDEYVGGTKVTDDYRWLENASDPKVQEWSEAQNKRAREYLGALPHAAEIRARVKQLVDITPPQYFGVEWHGGKLFAMKFQPPKNQPFLVVLASPEDVKSERALLDPNLLNPKGTTAIDWFEVSRDGSKLAVSLSENGTEEGTVHVYDVATGKEQGDTVPRVNGGTAGGSLTWNADGSGFYYTRYPRGNERPKEDMGFFTQVYFHKLGSKTEADTYEIGKDFPRIAEIGLGHSEDGKWTIAQVANGDGGEFAAWLKGPDGKWNQLTKYEDKVISLHFGLDDALYLLSRKDAPHGKILRLPLKTPQLAQAKEIVPTSDRRTIESFLPTKDRIYVADLVGGPSDLRFFDLTGIYGHEVPVLPVSTVGQLVRLDPATSEILVENGSYLEPNAYYRLGTEPKPVKTALATPSPVDTSAIEVVRLEATSKDGTKVPVSLLMKKGTRTDGKNPTILWGYGGFGVNITPFFSPLNMVWLEQGGIFAIANIRGGGEFGEQWHLQGNLTHKQNVFDDFYAVAKLLQDKGYTSHDKLALEGGSNGGLLMGALVTQHPDLAKAVVSFVGLYDMLRMELFPNGAFNVTEYGTVKNAEDFKAISAYSPYQHVVDKTAYPAMLLTTGINDPRVDPANSKKMTARLQAATSSKEPILLRITQSGHGIGSSLDERVAEQGDVFSFLFDELGVDYRAVAKGGS